MFCVRVYDQTHFCVHVRPKKATNGTLAIQTIGATDLKHGIHTQFDFRCNIGVIPPGYNTSHWFLRRKSAKKTKQKQLLNKDWT